VEAGGAPAVAALSGAGRTDIDRVYEAGEVDQVAAPIGGLQPPRYPAREKMIGREGRVVVRATIGADGALRSTEVVESAGRDFDAAALENLRRHRFAPARRGGRPVGSVATFVQAFELR
jgi:TonB family protein